MATEHTSQSLTASPANRRPIVFRGGRLVDAPTFNGEAMDLVVEAGRITVIGPPGMDAPEGADVVDATNRLILPGLVNAHTHGDGAFVKGFSDRFTLELLLNAGPILGAENSVEAKVLAARLAGAELLEKGCTACYDLFTEMPGPTRAGMEAVGAGYRGVGIRAVVAPLMADRTLWQAIPGLLDALPDDLRGSVEAIALSPMETALAQCDETARTWPYADDTIRFALGPTIPHHCAPEFFRACRKLADQHGLRLQTHLGESKVQAVAGQRLFGKSLTAHLNDLGMLGPDFTAAHAVWLDDDDVRMLADAGASVAHNPSSNMRLGCGIAATARMRAAGLPVGVGTDTCSCGDGLNMFEAMRLAAYVSRVHGPDPDTWLTAADAFAMGTVESARALGWGDAIGALDAGRLADLVLLDMDQLHYCPLNDARRQVIYAETGAGVDRVYVGGVEVVRGGRCSAIDRDSLRADVERLWERSQAHPDYRRARALVERLEPAVRHYCVGMAREPVGVGAYVGEGPAF